MSTTELVSSQDSSQGDFMPKPKLLTAASELKELRTRGVLKQSAYVRYDYRHGHVQHYY